MSPKRKTLKLPRWQLAVAAAASLATVAGVVVAASPVARHRGPDCRYCVDGNCTPNVQTYGYYQTHWRTWPKASSADSAVEADRERAKLPTQVEPPALQEDTDIVPRPSTKPGEKAPGVKPTTGEDIINPMGERPTKTPKTDKEDPFKDDPSAEESPESESNRAAPKGGGNPQTSILSAPTNDEDDLAPKLAEVPTDVEDGAESLEPTPVEDDAPTNRLSLVADAVPSSFESDVRETLPKKAAESSAPHRGEPDRPLRLIDPSRPDEDEATVESSTKNAHESAKPVAAEEAKPAEGANPLRSGWGARRPSTAKSSREPQVTSTFRGADGGNPLRR